MLYGEVVVARVQSAIGLLAVVRQPGPLANESEQQGSGAQQGKAEQEPFCSTVDRPSIPCVNRNVCWACAAKCGIKWPQRLTRGAIPCALFGASGSSFVSPSWQYR